MYLFFYGMFVTNSKNIRIIADKIDKNEKTYVIQNRIIICRFPVIHRYDW